MTFGRLDADFPGLELTWPATDYRAGLTPTMESLIEGRQTVGMDHPAMRYLGPPVSELPSTFWANSSTCPRGGGPFKLSFISDAGAVEFLMSGGYQSAELLVDGRAIQIGGASAIKTDASGRPYALTVQWVEARKRKYELSGINLLLRGVSLTPGASIWYPEDEDSRPLLLVLGDSLALGVGARSYGQSAPALMARALGFEIWSDGLGEAAWTTASAGEDVGSRTEVGALAVAARDGSGRKHVRAMPPVVASFLGFNDRGTDPEAIASAWTGWHAKVRAHFGVAPVAIVTFGPWMVGPGDQDLHAVDAALQGAVEAARLAGDDRVAFFSLVGSTRSRQVDEVLFQDGSHPSALGHKLIGLTAARRARRFIYDILPAARLCLPDATDTSRTSMCLLLTPEDAVIHVAASAAVSTRRPVVFDPWSALEEVRKPDEDGLGRDLIFHTADVSSFRAFCASLGPGWLRRRIKVTVATTQAFVAGLADPARFEDSRLVAELNELKAAGIEVGWTLIDPDGDGGDLASALEALDTADPKAAASRPASFGPCDIEDAARGIAAALPLFHAQFRPQDMCADDCMMTGETFSRIVCEPGFQSHLWGPLAQRMPVTRTGRGVLYIAYGTKYYRIAEHSAVSLKRYNPGLPVAIVTDEPERSPVFDYQFSPPGADRVIDEYFRVTSRMESMKFIAFPFSPFAETLFLDSDTTITAPLTSIFDEYPNEDIVLTNESRVALGADGHPIEKTLDFTDSESYNAGVFLYRSTPAAERYLTAWWAWFLWDQAGASRFVGNWGHTGVSDQSVLHLMGWSNFHGQLGVKLSFAPNTTYNATDRIWALLHKSGRWNEARVLHSKLPYYLRGTKRAEMLWQEEWPQRWL